MTSGRQYTAKYDYVELTIERRDDHWRLILKDTRHGETVENEDEFDNPAEAQDAALAMAQHHINVQHDDTLLTRPILSWRQD
jgi:hypothetical protein